MPLLRESPDDFAVLVERVANQLLYPLAFVERDYWITEILRSLAAPIASHTASVIFKGGTSLSKGWRLLQRMSEDIDIIVTFGPGVSNSARDRILKSLVERVEQDVGLQSTAKTSEKSVHRSRYFAYPQQHGHVALTGQRVLLELGTRGGPEPHQRLWVRSLLAEIACDDFGLSAVRWATLFEDARLTLILGELTRVPVRFAGPGAGRSCSKIGSERKRGARWL